MLMVYIVVIMVERGKGDVCDEEEMVEVVVAVDDDGVVVVAEW